MDDMDYMRLAIKRAEEAFAKGNLPIGAVLVFDREIIGSAHNTNSTNGDWNSHAETNLIRENARMIREASKQGRSIQIYSTLEPCLMCFGAGVLNRVKVIKYACPDPRGGATNLTPSIVREGYKDIWPETFYDSRLRQESCQLLLDYMIPRAPKWDSLAQALQNLRASWS